MKAVLFTVIVLAGMAADASESWVCMCYANAQKTDEVGGISLDPSLSLEQAEAEALNVCKQNEASTVAVSCTKFDDGEND